ncbi:FtsX-like permease family protein [Streptomyces liangshanensis]|uniref:ABC transporter permease n=1 Tax=Streptomyces liangshanensis TaxID=2717324 RepID=A0A6G9H6H0_9ACTN|nr:ABC transporter permease [Streptomyces liangshanensis]QIQ06142.1 ABC transporter permease [Streptomyces liangshanensis]
MTAFVLFRVRAHRLLLASAFLAVLLTTCVLTALVALSGSVGDASLRHALARDRGASTALGVSAQLPPGNLDAAQAAVVRGARQTFGGLPTTVRRLDRSGAYALPRALQDPAAKATYPDLTHFAALDRAKVELTAGTAPGPARGTAGSGRTTNATSPEPLPVALPQVAARRLNLRPGAVLTLTDRVSDKPLTVRLTGLYRPVDPSDPYWTLDSLGGRGVSHLVFTTYGPLLADPSVLSSGRTSRGDTGWLVTADFAGARVGDIGTLRTAATDGVAALGEDPALAGSVDVRSDLATVLTRAERALLVSRTTLMIVALQLVLLAGYALLLVARLLTTERTAETRLLRARGASGRRLAGLAALEALLLSLPAAVGAPLLAGPLVRLMTRGSVLGRLDLPLGGVPRADVWFTAVLVAACCAAAVLLPALAGSAGALVRGRAASLPAPVRAGADVGLLLVAGVALWQLSRRTGGALTGGQDGGLGMDPLLVAAPALALLAGTVLTLRLLPPAARLAERLAARGRGLSAALAGWQFSRRLLGSAGSVLLLVLAVATGMLAIGQNASWERSQNDQADFGAGTSVRVLAPQGGTPGEAGRYAALPGVRAAAPAHRTTTALSDGRTATVLALDTEDARDRLLLREDLAGEPADRLLAPLRPRDTPRPGILLPADTRGLTLAVRIGTDGKGGMSGKDGKSDKGGRGGKSEDRAAARVVSAVTVLVEDGYGLRYSLPAGEVPADGRVHSLPVDLDSGPEHGSFHGALTLIGLHVTGPVPPGARYAQRFDLVRVGVTDRAGAAGTVPVPEGLRWRGSGTATVDAVPGRPGPLRPAATATTPLSLPYRLRSGVGADTPYPPAESLELRVEAARSPIARRVPGIATDAFLRATGAAEGQRIDVTLAGERIQVTLVRAVRRLPTTAPDEAVTAGGAAATGEPAASGNGADGGALLLDLRTVNEVLAQRDGGSLAPNEWWLSTDPGAAGRVATSLRAGPDVDTADVLVRDEAAAELFDDPLGAGPYSALPAVAVAAAALAAVGFAVMVVGTLRERSAELAVLRALGTPRRRLVGAVAAEHGVLVGVALLVGLVLGTALTRTVVPLVVLTSRATTPLPPVLVQLPLPQVVLLLAGVAALPLLTVAVAAARSTDPTVTPRHRGAN